MGCVVTNGREYEIPYGFEDLVVDGAVLIIVWSGHDALTKQGEVRDKVSPTYKGDVSPPR